jgi:origin recognition complex subunit 2
MMLSTHEKSRPFPKSAIIVTSETVPETRPTVVASFVITSSAIHTHGKRAIKLQTGLTNHDTSTQHAQEDWMATQRHDAVHGVSGKELFDLHKRRIKRKHDAEHEVSKAALGLEHRQRLRKVADDASSSDSDVPTLSDRYFDQTNRTKKTSNNTLESMPKLSHVEYQQLLRKPTIAFHNKHQKEVEALNQAHTQQFQSWKFELQHFNLCFHGTGSKRQIVNQFAQFCSREQYPLLIVNGYLPTASIKHIIQSMIDALLPNETMGRISDGLDKLRRHFEQTEQDFFLVIHSIDAPALRAPQTQQLLSTLASFSKLHLICTVDHRNVALLWDVGIVERFKFLWHDLTTLQPYTRETAFDDSGMVEGIRNKCGFASAQHVLKSVSQQARKIFQLLAQHQLKSETMSMSSLFRACSDDFIVSSQETFKSQVREFKDHNLFQTKASSNGEQVCIPLKREELEKVLELLK